MKFAATFLTLALGVQASLHQRDIDSIKKVLSDISTQVQGLDTAVNAFSGDTKALLAAGATLLSTIKSGANTVSSSDKLDILSASQVAQSVTGLNTSVATTVTDLIAKKQAIVAAGAGGDVLKNLQDQKVASQALSDAITSKVPTELQTVAKQLSQGVDDSLSTGIAAYSNTGGSSSAPPPASTDHSGGGHSSSSAAPTPKPSTAPSATSSTPPPAKGSSASSSSTGKPAVSSGGAVANRFSGALAALAVVMAF